MSNYDDLSDKKFGRLTAICKTGVAKNRTILWKCICACGSIRIVRANHLKSLHTTSCGCYHKENAALLHSDDLIGKQFGRLKVVKKLNKKIQRANVWECLCGCGNVVEVHTASLNSGHTKSCGCLHFDMVWKGGISKEPYCQDWTKDLKGFVKERDNYKCINPYCVSKAPNNLSVHHINYNKKSCEPENLITICRSCNSAANKDRNWHEAWYKAILNKRYDYRY